MSRIVFYARVSTTDQNPDHQAPQARAAGSVIDEVVTDHGVSGVATLLALTKAADAQIASVDLAGTPCHASGHFGHKGSDR